MGIHFSESVILKKLELVGFLKISNTDPLFYHTNINIITPKFVGDSMT